MARVTVEDCLDHVDNRFDLVLVASKRAHQLATTGAEPAVEWENDKATVVALRELAAGHKNLAEKEEARVRGIDTTNVESVEESE